MNRNWPLVALCACVGCHAASAGSEPRPTTPLQPIVVTATPLTTALDAAPRATSVITRTDIEASPARSLEDLLADVAGVDIRRRGGPGVQADLGIRGSNFEQTLVLIDGVPIGNPQTGHHNLDIPVPLAHIQRIEIIKGPGAIQYGGSGTGGVINIVTRRPQQPAASADVAFGSHASRQFSATLGIGNARDSQMLSASRQRSASEDAAQPTDADLHSALYTGRHAWDHIALDWGLGASHKAFGAWAFYSADYPDARERTASRLAWLGAKAQLGAWQAAARAYWNGHDDWFRTRIAGTDYINRHATDSAGVKLDLRRDDAHGSTALGADYGHDSLRSNALADHRRSRTSWWFVRQQHLAAKLDAEVGLSHVRYRNDRAYWLPSLALAWRFTDGWRAFTSAARAARAPSYTELDLATAANRGNPDLTPERSQQFEIGLAGGSARQHFEASVFERRIDNLIDWTRAPGATTWVAANLPGYRGRGGEVSWRLRPAASRLEEFGLSYARLAVHLAVATGPVKYAPHVPTSTWRAHARWQLTPDWQVSANLRRPEYARQSSATLAAARVAWHRGHWHAYVEVNNAFNQRIVETGFAAIAGRWYYAGIGFDL